MESLRFLSRSSHLTGFFLGKFLAWSLSKLFLFLFSSSLLGSTTTCNGGSSTVATLLPQTPPAARSFAETTIIRLSSPKRTRPTMAPASAIWILGFLSYPSLWTAPAGRGGRSSSRPKPESTSGHPLGFSCAIGGSQQALAGAKD